ncbi:MAG: EpsI family protein [Isosphaeraceae bacterium]|nr:EpsI family protein [Isosphaeraceae bacterium]
MSVTDLTTEPGVAATSTAVRARGVSAGTWVRVLLVCALLAASGVIRWKQTQRFQALSEAWKDSPFPLDELPLTIGPWRGEAAKLEDQIARATGATDHILRRYVNQATGVKVDLIVLYGPATSVFIHRPETCYPAAGFELAEAQNDHTVQAGDLRAPFRALVYVRGEGGQTERQEVYYSWRYNGHWSPDVGTFKQLERIPGMYKVHLARRITEHEKRDVGNPCEAFLQALLPTLEQRVRQAQQTPSSSSSP